MKKRPEIPIQFRGLHLAGNPAARPSMTASVCSDFRVMPGNWLRLRGGRQAKRNEPGGTIQQMHGFRDPNFPGSASHIAQVKYTGAGTAYWKWFDLATYTFDPFGDVSISLAYDSSYALSNLVASTNITDRPVMYNGLGVRDGTNSRPPFSTYYAGVKRYFGLDAYCPAGTFPTVAFVAGAGHNTIGTSVKISVGLYHEPTGHYSNAVEAGSISTTGATGTITVSNLSRLSVAYNNATEQGELKYVFYASVDGGEIPYLILNAALTGPLTAASTDTSKSLSVQAATFQDPNGYPLDTTSEMPTENFPPRPMKSVTTVNGKIYGIPLQGGSGSGADFTYQWQTRSMAGVCWSKAFSDDRESKGVGDPQQCWPLSNIKNTPNIETPLWLAPSMHGDAVLVWTPRSTFIMTELSTGLHVFNDISRIHGLKSPSTVRVTDYGICWVDQRNQFCMLTGDTKDDLVILSRHYQGAIGSKTPTCADYLLDPNNEIDRYQVWFSDGTFIYHDFALKDSVFPLGQACSGTNSDFTAAATLVAQDGSRHHVVAKGGFYTHEAQPDTGLIPTRDVTFVNTSDQTTTTVEINGTYRFNWDPITDWNERTLLAVAYAIGDGATSAQLGATPIKMQWWGDFAEVPGTTVNISAVAVAQASNAWHYQFVPTQANKLMWKIGFTLNGHATDDADFLTHRNPAVEGNLDKNFYGSICSAALLIGNEGMRP